MADRMKIKILDDVTASPKLTDGERRSFASPATCRLQNGDILCVYRRGKDKHSRDGVFMVQRSTDAGRTWSEPIVIYDGMRLAVPESVHAGAVCQAKDGTVLAMFTAVDVKDPDHYIFSEIGRLLEHRFYVARSRDHGRTWTTPQPHVVENTPSLRYTNSRPLALPDGDLIVPIEVTTATKQQAVMISRFSSSKGTFEPAFSCADDATGRLSFGDPKLVRLPDGRVLLWLWAFVNATEETVQAHACVSNDDARTWSKPSPTELCCQNSALWSLGDGRVIVAGNVRISPEGIRLWCSSDAGRTWDSRVTVQMWDARKHKMIGEVMSVAGPSGKDSSDGRLWESLPGFTFGSPDLVPADDRALLLTYYVMADGFAEVRACRFLVD